MKFNEIFEYRDGKLFKDGIEVGRTSKAGYVVVSIKSKNYYAHRIIFEMHHGRSPIEVDHINGIKSDNRIENLREANRSQNNCNTLLSKANKSGVKGVSFHAYSNKWRSVLYIGGKQKHIGEFLDIESAKYAIEAARKQLHGEFANHG